MIWIASIAAIAVGVTLGALGGGGSILVLPILVYLLDVSEKAAIATSLLVVGTTSLFAMIPYARAHNVEWKIGAMFGVFAMLGAAFGGWVAQFFAGAVLLILFAAFMLITSIAMFRGKKQSDGDGNRAAMHWIAVEGVIVGAVTGLVGAGGGFLVVPALVLLGGLSMRKAIGTSLMVIALKSAAGFWSFSTHVVVDYELAAIFAVFAVAGAFLGQRIARNVDATKLRKIFAGFVLVMGVFVLSQQIHWLLTTGFAIFAVALAVIFSMKSTRLEEAHDAL